MNIEFRTPTDHNDLKMLSDFLSNQDLGYPDYHSWVDRTYHELDDGYKNSIIAWNEGKIIGNVIFQPHKEIAGIREIKNLRIDKDFRCRKFGSFLLRQAEWVENSSYDIILADFRENQVGVSKLFEGEGYDIIGYRNLYEIDYKDFIVMKNNTYK